MGLVKRLLSSNSCFSITESASPIIKIFHSATGCHHAKRAAKGSITKQLQLRSGYFFYNDIMFETKAKRNCGKLSSLQRAVYSNIELSYRIGEHKFCSSFFTI